MTLAGAAASTWIAARVDLNWLPAPLFGFAVFLGLDGIRKVIGEIPTWGLLALGIGAGWVIALPGDGALFFKGWLQWTFFMSMFGVGMYSVRVFLNVSERFLVLFWIGMMFVMMIGPRAILSHMGYVAPSGVFHWAAWGAGCGLLYLLVASFLEEDVVHLPPEKLHPFLVPASSTLKMIAEDEEFYEEYFSRVYPDGLLPYQHEALRERCKEKKIKTVAIKQTMPFACWIFTGALISVLLRYDVLTYFLKVHGNG